MNSLSNTANGTFMTGYGHTEFLKSLVTTYNPQELKLLY